MPEPNDIFARDTASLAECLRSGKYSAAEVVDSHFARIERLNPTFNALVTLDRERAAARARQADESLRRGVLWGPLHGVPVTIKDAIKTSGLRTTAGFDPMAASVPDENAAVVERLLEAGAIILGKSNCAKLCLDVQTSNTLFGTTNNPWGPRYTSGGSSGGEAAAVALGMSPLGIGTDTGGSIRIPASYCGVFGLKPSIHKLNRRGLLPLKPEGLPISDSLTVVGPIARSARDLALCFEVLSGESVIAAPPLGSIRIAWSQDFANQSIDDEVSATLRSQFEKLCAAGARPERVESPVDLRRLMRLCLLLLMYEFLPKEYNRFLYSTFRGIDLLVSLARGGRLAGYRALKRRQEDACERFDEFMSGYDCWAIPATPTTAFPHQPVGRRLTITKNGRAVRNEYLSGAGGYCYPINFLGVPSVSVPIGLSRQGLPIGMQLVGKRGQDAALLGIATRLCETMVPMPPVPGCTH